MLKSLLNEQEITFPNVPQRQVLQQLVDRLNSENCVEDPNGNGVFDNFKLSIRNIAYNNIQDKMWGYLGNLYFTPKMAKDFIPAVYEYCVNNFIIYAVDYMTKEEQNKEYAQFLIHKAIKDYNDLKQLAEVLSL